MTPQERFILAALLAFIAITITVDLSTDSREGAALWHLLTEGSVALLAFFGIFYLMRDTFSLKKDLRNERAISLSLKKEADEWRNRSRKYLEGLSSSIDKQLSDWNLTAAEKEVAFLLLKGMALKEIAQLRSTTEKTARVQSMAVYSKAGLAGRSELAAFFLEDLLVPADKGSDKS